MRNLRFIIKILSKTLCYTTVATAVLATSCSTHHNSAPNPSAQKNNTLYFGQLSAIPMVKNSSTHSYYVSLYNGTGSAISISPNDITISGMQKEDMHKYGLKNIDPSNMIDITNCSILATNGECQVKLTLNPKAFASDTGNFALTIKGHHVKDDTEETTSTIISYFTPKSQKIAINTNGVGMVNMITPQPMSINIPILFNKQGYSNLEVKSGGLVGAHLVGCSTAVSAGSSCMLTVNLVGGKEFNSSVVVTGTPTTALNNAQTEQLLYLPIKNSLLARGHLLVGTTASSIVADGTSQLTLTLHNNGTAQITLPKPPSIFEGSSPLHIDSLSTCASSLAANASCSLVITVDKVLTSAIHHVHIVYNDGTNALTVQYPIIIKPYTGAYGSIDVIISGSSLVNINKGSSATATITLTNNGNVDVSNLNHVYVGGLPKYMSELNNSCTSHLNKNGGSCSYQIRFAPDAVVSYNSLTMSFSGDYIDEQGDKTIYNKESIYYSSINYQNYLDYEPATMIFNTNTTQTVLTTIIVTNNTASKHFNNLAFDFSSITSGYKDQYSAVENPSAYVKYKDCRTIGDLAPGAQCAMSAQLDPTKDGGNPYANNDLGSINIGFSDSVSSYTDAVAYSSNVIASGVNIQASTNWDTLCGTSTQHCRFNTVIGGTNSDGDFHLAITYHNSGTEDATNFSVSSLIPVGYLVDNVTPGATTCPTNGTTGTLAAGDSCIILLNAYNKDIKNAAAYFGALNIDIPEISYTDASGNFFVMNSYGMIYVDVNALSGADMTISNPVYDPSSFTFSSTVTFVGGSLNPDNQHIKFTMLSPSGIPGSITTSSSSGAPGNTDNYCDIYNNWSTCSITVTYYNPVQMNVNILVASPELSSLTWLLNNQNTNIPVPPTSFVYTQTSAGGNISPLAVYSGPSGVTASTQNMNIISNSITGQMQIVGNNLVMVGTSSIVVYPILGDGNLDNTNKGTTSVSTIITGSSIVSVTAGNGSTFYVADSNNKVYTFTINSNNTVNFGTASTFDHSLTGMSYVNGTLYLNESSDVYVCSDPTNVATSCVVSGNSFDTALTSATYAYNGNIILSYAGSSKALMCTLNSTSPYISSCSASSVTLGADITNINMISKSYKQMLSSNLYMTFSPSASSYNQIGLYNASSSSVSYAYGSSNAVMFSFSN
jgi:hypothetical protein